MTGAGRDPFDPELLALREAFDAAARSAALADRLIAMLPTRPCLLEIAPETGALFRWLAPRIGRAQVWQMVDSDAARLDEAYAAIAEWAEARGYAVSFPQRAMLVHAPGGAWRVEALRTDIAQPALLPLDDADAVVCSGLLDQVSESWLWALAETLDVPFLATLCADGRESWLPPHPLDAALRAARRRRERRDRGFGPALGAASANAALDLLDAAGFRVFSAPSPRRIPRFALPALQREVEREAALAAASSPRRAAIGAWRTARRRQALAGRLAIAAGHRDILAVRVDRG